MSLRPVARPAVLIGVIVLAAAVAITVTPLPGWLVIRAALVGATLVAALEFLQRALSAAPAHPVAPLIGRLRPAAPPDRPEPLREAERAVDSASWSRAEQDRHLRPALVGILNAAGGQPGPRSDGRLAGLLAPVGRPEAGRLPGSGLEAVEAAIIDLEGRGLGQ